MKPIPNLWVAVVLSGVVLSLVPTSRAETNNDPQPTQEERNKKLVLDFFQGLYIDKNVESVDNFIDAEPEKFIDHNPGLPDGREPFKALFREILKQPWKAQVLRAAAEGDLVWLHMKVQSKALTDVLPGNPETVSIIDIFKVKDGKIVELWDVTQGVPTKSVSDHPMF